MSYEIVKSISIKNDEVWVRSCLNSIYPKIYESWVSEGLTKIYQSEGKDGLYKAIGEELWKGDWRLQKGTKLCDLFLQAKQQLSPTLDFSNTCHKAAGEYFKDAVLKLENDRCADLSNEIQTLNALRNNRDYILETVSTYGWNYLDSADFELQHDREFAMQVVQASKGCCHFDFPSAFKNDKEFAMEALLLNGCWYRQLGHSLQMDHDIIFRAFDKTIDRRYVEHMPNAIPLEAFYYGDTPDTQPLDVSFLYTLMEVAPHMHMWHSQSLLQDWDDFLQWYQCATFSDEAMNLIIEATKRENPPFTIEDLESYWYQKDLLGTCQNALDKEVLKSDLEEYEIAINEEAFGEIVFEEEFER